MPDHEPSIRFQDQVAVVTGAASGIGLSITRHLMAAGATVAMWDVETGPLEAAQEKLCVGGARVSTWQVDVSSAEDVERAATEVWERYGTAQLLFNNAGVSVRGGKPIWERTPGEWEWVLGVNVQGIANGLRSFVPRMLAGGQSCHIVNTGSRAGLFSPPHSGAYVASKHAVVGLTEQLHRELRAIDALISVSVLCLTFSQTAGANAERNRPRHLRDEVADGAPINGDDQLEQIFGGGQPPDEIARITLQAVRKNRFYIFPTERIFDVVHDRYDDMKAGRAPRSL